MHSITLSSLAVGGLLLIPVGGASLPVPGNNTVRPAAHSPNPASAVYLTRALNATATSSTPATEATGRPVSFGTPVSAPRVMLVSSPRNRTAPTPGGTKAMSGGKDPYGYVNDPYGDDPYGYGDDSYGYSDDPYGDDPYGDDPYGDTNDPWRETGGMPPPEDQPTKVPVYWNPEEGRWLPTPKFEGIATIGETTDINKCDPHSFQPDASFIGLGVTWMGGDGWLSRHCLRLVRVVNMGSMEGPNLRVGGEMRIPVGGECPDCPFNSVQLSYGAFREMTGGLMSPPTSLNIAWEFVDE